MTLRTVGDGTDWLGLPRVFAAGSWPRIPRHVVAWEKQQREGQ
jgi:hypothetical protein